MYDPVNDGMSKLSSSVSYEECEPPEHLAEVVHCFWSLKTTADRQSDFWLHALPDACVNILFNQLEPTIAGVTALQTTYTELNLGRVFSYTGIQFFPGVWRGEPKETVDHYVGEPYSGGLPLVDVSIDAAKVDFPNKVPILCGLVETLLDTGVVEASPLMAKILTHIDRIHTVSDMAEISGTSPRQLQRNLKASTGFTPHNFLKVLRLQQTFKRSYQTLFADQSHFIHSFKAMTGYTPKAYFAKFDVRNLQYEDG